MAREETGELTPTTVEPRSSLDLLQHESALRDWIARRVPHGLELEVYNSRSRRFPWPPAEPIRKSIISSLLSADAVLQSVPTAACQAQLPAMLPACVKPDIGSLGHGFRAIHTPNDWLAFLESNAQISEFVVQPLLKGPEHRVTLCADGTYASAELMERHGTRSRWTDSTSFVPADWLVDLHAILRTIGTPVIGVDILRSDEVAYVLDINLAPDLCVHLVTDTPRNLAAAVMDSWLAAQTDVPT